MRTILTSVCGMMVLCCLAAFLWTAEAEMQSTNFWTEAAQGGMAEVAMGNLAVQKGQSEQVRQFGQQMVTEHTAANQELMTLAAGKGVTLPADMGEKHRAAMVKLEARSGMDFDMEYMKTQVKDHERMVKLFEREAERGTDADAKAFAAKTLPVLQGHLTMARSMRDGMKNMDRGNSSNNNSSPNTNSSNVNRSTNVRQDTNRNPNRNNNANGNTNTNANNSNTNSNTNSRSNANNGNTNNSNMNHY